MGVGHKEVLVLLPDCGPDNPLLWASVRGWVEVRMDRCHVIHQL